MTSPAGQAGTAPRRVALLGGVNLGPARTVDMARLRHVAEGLCWTDVATHLRSGNVLFRAPESDAATAARLATALRQEFGLEVGVVIRTATHLRTLVEQYPFLRADPSRAVIVCCDSPVPQQVAARLAGLAAGSERVRVAGSDIFAEFPDGQARSKLAAQLVSAVKPVTCTARNLRTVTRLAQLLHDEG